MLRFDFVDVIELVMTLNLLILGSTDTYASPIVSISLPEVRHAATVSTRVAHCLSDR